MPTVGNAEHFTDLAIICFIFSFHSPTSRSYIKDTDLLRFGNDMHIQTYIIGHYVSSFNASSMAFLQTESNLELIDSQEPSRQLGYHLLIPLYNPFLALVTTNIPVWNIHIIGHYNLSLLRPSFSYHSCCVR